MGAARAASARSASTRSASADESCWHLPCKVLHGGCLAQIELMSVPTVPCEFMSLITVPSPSMDNTRPSPTGAPRCGDGHGQ
eukprot:8075368-Prorocentrum_lima.AAC.1